MRKPTLCGSNRINMPTSGCTDCDALAYRIDKLEEWKTEFVDEGYNALNNKPTINGVTVEGDKTSEDYLITPISAADIIALTPMECYVPPCADSRVCYGEVCCMVVACNTSTSSLVCEGGVCYAEVSCEEPEPEPEPTVELSASIDLTPSGYTEDDTIDVVYEVRNTGEVNLTNIAVTATKTGGSWTTDLGVGESQSYGGGMEAENQITYTITTEDVTNGSVTFDLTASCTYDGESVTASATETLELR